MWNHSKRLCSNFASFLHLWQEKGSLHPWLQFFYKHTWNTHYAVSFQLSSVLNVQFCCRSGDKTISECWSNCSQPKNNPPFPMGGGDECKHWSWTLDWVSVFDSVPLLDYNLESKPQIMKAEELFQTWTERKLAIFCGILSVFPSLWNLSSRLGTMQKSTACS